MKLILQVSIATLLILLALFCQAQAEGYTGYTEYDGRQAELQLNFAGPAASPTVTGRLLVNRICEPGVHLTGVDLTLTGTASGPWEDPATTISGSWTGGDTDPCTGSPITNDPAFPVAGGFAITMATSDGKKVIRLVRMPTGYGYIFDAKGFVYAPSGGSATGAKEIFVDSGAADLKITALSVPTGMKPGMTAKVEVTFTNQGTGDAGPFEVYSYAFSKQNYQYSIESDPVSVPGLEAGGSKNATLTISVPLDSPTGSWDVKVAIDNSNYAGTGSVKETDENNNEKWKRDVLEPEMGSSEDSSTVEAAAGVKGEETTTGGPVLIFERNTLGGVENSPINPTKFTLDRTYLITEVRTYHWNYGKGQTPGTIGIQDEEGIVLKVMQATGLEGMGGVSNAYWSIQPSLRLSPGEYTIIDSEPSTWSQNWETGGQGIAWVYGLEISESEARGAEDVISEQPADSGSSTTSETQSLDESDSADSSTAEFWLTKGFEAFWDVEYEKALGYFEWALKIDPGNYDALLAKCDALLALERYQDAYYCALEALAIDDTNYHAWYLKGDALNGLGLYDQANQAWEQARSLDLDNGDVLTDSFIGGLEGVVPGEAI